MQKMATRRSQVIAMTTTADRGSSQAIQPYSERPATKHDAPYSCSLAPSMAPQVLYPKTRLGSQTHGTWLHSIIDSTLRPTTPSTLATWPANVRVTSEPLQRCHRRDQVPYHTLKNSICLQVRLLHQSTSLRPGAWRLQQHCARWQDHKKFYPH